MIQAWLIRQMPWVLISLALIGSGWAVGAWLMEKGRAEMRPQIQKLQAELDNERAARIRNEEAVNGYLKELEGLRSRPRPTSPVRLCVTPRQAEPAARTIDDSPTTGGSRTSPDGENNLAGPDIGPPLRELAYQCDAENAKLRALQNWVRSWVN